jgi:hypothetical protein
MKDTDTFCDAYQVVGFCSNPGRTGVSHEETVMPVTRADDGPLRHFSIILSTVLEAPEKTASTEPLRQFRTQPSRPSSLALSTVHFL